LRKTGGKISIIAGVLGFVAAALLFAGSVGSEVKAPAKPRVDAPQRPSPASAGLGIIGTWTGVPEGDRKMSIDPAPGGFKISLRVSTPSGCAGSIEGFGTRSGDTLTLTQKGIAQDCIITIRFAGEKAEVSEKMCADYHGAACGFRGTFAKDY
jgi:hypothetical protein